jgi:hypothetical protein
MAKIKVTVGLAGQKGLSEAFDGVKTAVKNKVLKGACRKEAGKAVKVAKSFLSRKRTGQLNKSIAYVYRTYRRGNVWLYVVGPKHGFRVRVNELTRAGQRAALNRLSRRPGRRRVKLTEAQSLKFLQSYVDPVKYAHLVEGGRKAVRPVEKKVMSGGGSASGNRGMTVYGKKARGVQPRPFMEPAAQAVAVDATAMATDIMAGIEREAWSRAAKGKTIKG